jgi:hypothetical protein
MPRRFIDTRMWVSRVLAAIVAAFVLCLSLAAPGTPAVADPQDLCTDQIAALQAVNTQIEAHNAAPHVFTIPDQQAAANAYNAEAQQLNAARDAAEANLQGCTDAMEALANADNTTADLPAVPDNVKSQIEAAKKQIPDSWQPPAPPSAGKNWRVPPDSPIRPLFDVLRKNNPGPLGTATLRGSPRPAAGATDFAYPASSGRVFGANDAGVAKASPDHIIPLAQIVNLPNFTKLSAQNMYAVTRAPLNYQWLSWSANTSKQSRSVAFMTGVDPGWQASQVQLENEVLAQLQNIINQLLKSQG